MSTKPSPESTWLPAPTVRDVFMDFPLPLAMMGEAGNVELVNACFTARFDTAILDGAELRRMVRDPGQSWQPVRVACRDGQLVDAWAQALRVQTGVMVLVDEAGIPQSASGTEELRARIAALERQSATDHLTGAWNRAHLDRSVAAEMARSCRLRQPVSLVLLDIDHFKDVNDRFGHQTGDSVLCELVAACMRAVRKADVLFRWGGEEFVILATSTGYRNAEVLAEALRKAVEHHDFTGVGALTVSVGVAEHIETESSADWFGRVDAALYRAKEGGRNRVVVDRRGSSDIWAAQSGPSALHLVWQEAYECGQETIDGQHRELFELANVLLDLSVANAAPSRSSEVALDNFLTHVVKHFHDEESLLEARQYAGLAAHKAAHAGLLRRAGELHAAALHGGLTLGVLVKFLANDVVADHMFVTDRAFFPLFRPA